MKSSILKFEDPSLDALFVRWLENGLTSKELGEWKIILSTNNQFRESFCDWIKTLRDSKVLP